MPSTYSLLSDCFKHIREHGSMPGLDSLSDEGEASYKELLGELNLFYSLVEEPHLSECYNRLLNRLTYFINQHYNGDDILPIYKEIGRHPKHPSLWGME